MPSKKNPPRVFTYLRHSSLHWDERVYLPLPRLKHTLLIAATQDVEQTLREIAFIISERPQQLRAARKASLTIAIQYLEMRKSLSEIAQASQRLAEILPQEAGLIDPRWITPFKRLNDASIDTARYCSPVSRQARRKALEDMIENLGKVHPRAAFRGAQLNKRLGQVVNTWLEVARCEQEKLSKTSLEIGQIDNPFNPGQVLTFNTSGSTRN